MHMRKLETACEVAIEARMQERMATACIEEALEVKGVLSEEDRQLILQTITVVATTIASDEKYLQASKNFINMRSMAKALGSGMAKEIAGRFGGPIEQSEGGG